MGRKPNKQEDWAGFRADTSSAKDLLEKIWHIPKRRERKGNLQVSRKQALGGTAK